MKNKIKTFLDTLDRSPRTVFAYQNALNQFVSVVGEDAELNLESYTTFLVSIKATSPSTKRVYTTAVRKLYAFHKAWNSDELKEATKHYTHNQGRRIVNFNREAVEQVIAYCQSLDGDLTALRDRAFAGSRERCECGR